MASIILDSVSVDFPIYNVNSRSFKRELFNLTTGGLIKSEERKCVIVRALSNISFTLNHGDRVALIGHNGAGKSTLLNVLNGVYEPVSGSIKVEGEIFSLLNLTSGYNRESTGYENIILKGLLIGLSRKQILSLMDAIIEFSELGEYIYMPIRIYSQGMLMRLTFSIIMNMKPDILLLDEMISTGDASFKVKAKKKIDSILDSANIVVLASHSEGLVKEMCNRALLFEHGKLLFDGNVSEAFDIYNGNSSANEKSKITHGPKVGAETVVTN